MYVIRAKKTFIVGLKFQTGACFPGICLQTIMAKIIVDSACEFGNLIIRYTYGVKAFLHPPPLFNVDLFIQVRSRTLYLTLRRGRGGGGADALRSNKN